MRRVFVFIAALCSTVLVVPHSRAGATAPPVQPHTLYPTTVVTVVPKYGYAAQIVRVRLSHSEVDIVRRLQAASIAPSVAPDNATSTAIFITEPSAATSPTIALGTAAMHKTGELMASNLNGNPNRTFVIIGRTQEFINNAIRSTGCQLDLFAMDDAFQMGATICNRQVIVINLTGYLFLRNRLQTLTMEMESWPEPRLAAISYLIADRNIAGLAHEWVHVARSYIARGLIPDNEPAWFREGLAEVVSGMARVRASSKRMTYMDFHVIRLRKFARWPSLCTQTIDHYRDNSTQVSGCEYLRGAAAIELLIANYGGLQKIIRLYEDLRSTADFYWSFRRIYGMSITDFEHRADTYARYITLAATQRS